MANLLTTKFRTYVNLLSGSRKMEEHDKRYTLVFADKLPASRR